MSRVHTLILTKLDAGGLVGPTASRFSVKCPGVTNACRMSMPCNDPRCLHDDCPQTPSDRCYFLVADEFVPDTLPEAVQQLVRRERLGPGRYAVTHVFGDVGVDELTLVKEPRRQPVLPAPVASTSRRRRLLRWAIVIAVTIAGILLTRSWRDSDDAAPAPAGWIRVSCEPWMGDPPWTQAPAGPCYAPPQQLTPLPPQCGPQASMPCYTPEATPDPTGRTPQ